MDPPTVPATHLVPRSRWPRCLRPRPCLRGPRVQTRRSPGPWRSWRPQQVRTPLDVVIDGARGRDLPGDWPQYFHLRGADWLRVRDVSPFTVAFIHHALARWMT